MDVDGSGLRTVAALAIPGRLAIYDWETSVLGPHGRPVPADDSVTGGPGARQVATVPQDEAVARAVKAGSTDGLVLLRLVDDTAQKVLAGPQWTREALTGGGAEPAGARVVEVPGGVRVVQAEGAGPGDFYVLGDGAALGNDEISRARAETDPAPAIPSSRSTSRRPGAALSTRSRARSPSGFRTPPGWETTRCAPRSTWRSSSTTGSSPCRSSTTRRSRTASTASAAPRSRAACRASAPSRSPRSSTPGRARNPRARGGGRAVRGRGMV